VTQEVRVLVVDDHTLLVDSLAMVLATHGVSVVRPDLTSAVAVQDQAREAAPDLVILDLDLELGGVTASGEDLIAPLLEDGHPILVMSGTRDEARLGRCLVLGAWGVLSKALPAATLVEHIVTAVSGGSVLPPGRREQLIAVHRREQSHDDARQAMLGRLSAREQSVLEALVEGESVGRIAATFVLSEATVRSHVRSILTKLEVKSQLEAVAVAGRHGWFR
jgi:DNA-binding NarL/FixJ family response regulator